MNNVFEMKKPLKMPFTLLTETAIQPSYGSQEAVGLDLYADLVDFKDEQFHGFPFSQKIFPGDRFVCPTGIAIALPEGYYGRIAPRSGLAVKKGIDILAGVVDADYRGELKVVLINLGDTPVFIEQGDKVAQLVVTRADQVDLMQVYTLPRTNRGDGGFGSTGN